MFIIENADKVDYLSVVSTSLGKIMSESKFNTLTSQGYQTFKQSMMKSTSFFSILLVTIGIVSSSHSAIASTNLVTEQAVMPNSTLYAQMDNGSMNGRMHKSKMHRNMGHSKMHRDMGHSKTHRNMGRSMNSKK